MIVNLTVDIVQKKVIVGAFVDVSLTFNVVAAYINVVVVVAVYTNDVVAAYTNVVVVVVIAYTNVIVLVAV